MAAVTQDSAGREVHLLVQSSGNNFGRPERASRFFSPTLVVNVEVALHLLAEQHAERLVKRLAASGK
jgi:hypothetical protein